jgi:glycosyltransferase involved in cell wall biosynthesis
VKVLQLGKYYPPEHGGMEAAVRELTEGLNATGLRTDVLCTNRHWRTAEEAWPGGYRVVRAAAPAMLLSTPVAPALLTQARRLLPAADVVHLHMPNPMAALALRFTPFRGRLVVHWHSDVVRQRIALRLYEPLQRWVLQRADAIIATSERYAGASAALQPWQSKLAVVPIGIADHRARACCCQGASVRARYAGKKIVFALGRMAGYKGFDVLVQAAALLPKDTVVIIGGGGELLDRLRDRVAEAGLGERVVLPGPIPEEDLSVYFSAADVFCMPSTTRAEAFGIAMVEAMSAGKPIVATDIAGSGVPWVNLDGLTGLNVMPGSPSALANALRRLLVDPSLGVRLGEAGRQRYLTEFTAGAMTRRVVDLYRCLNGAEPRMPSL